MFPMEEEGESSDSGANSEIRFITMELMKLAQKSGKTFDEIAREYMQNAEKLHSLLSGTEEEAAHRARKGAVSREK